MNRLLKPAIICMFGFSSAWAQEPTTQVPHRLCDARSANSLSMYASTTPPQKLEGTVPEYPFGALEYASEGLVELEYNIDPNGLPVDVVAKKTLGRIEFEQFAITGVSKWKYAPAIAKGRPVTTYGLRVIVAFLISNEVPRDQFLHNDALDTFTVAYSAWKKGNYPSAISTLESAIKASRTTTDLSMHEHARLNLLLASSYVKSGDLDRATPYAANAAVAWDELIRQNPDLAQKSDAILSKRLSRYLEMRNGDYSNIECALVPNWVDANDDLVTRDTANALEQQMRAEIRKPTMTISAFLEPTSDGGVWEHIVRRPKFRFTDIQGNPKSFRLTCSSELLDGVPNLSTTWASPMPGGKCRLRVTGDPGARLKLEQFY